MGLIYFLFLSKNILCADDLYSKLLKEQTELKKMMYDFENRLPGKIDYIEHEDGKKVMVSIVDNLDLQKLAVINQTIKSWPIPTAHITTAKPPLKRYEHLPEKSADLMPAAPTTASIPTTPVRKQSRCYLS